MRTAVLKKQIEEYYQLLMLETERIAVNGNEYQKIKNWKEISLALHKLNEFKFMGKSVEHIFDRGANFIASTDTTLVLSRDYQDFLNLFNIVKSKCEAIIDMENGDIPKEDKDCLYIKLPENLKEINDLDIIIKGLNTSFNLCPVLRDTYKEVNFVGVDVGSNWLILSVILTGAPIVAKTLNWIADFIKKCNDIRIQNRNIKKMDLEYLISKTEFVNEEKKKIIDSIQKGLETDIKEECIQKFNEIGIPIKKKITNEEEGKIVHSMITMSNILEMGVEIYPSIDSTQELKNCFPKKEEWKKIGEKQRLIGDNNENEKR